MTDLEKLVPFTEAAIKHMVDRFLSWRLPDTFSPDGGVTFYPPINLKHLWPTGTNILDATQAEAMVRHMLDGLPASPSQPVAGAEAPSLEERVRHLELWGTANVDDWLDTILKRLDAADVLHAAILKRIEGLMEAQAGSIEGETLVALADAVQAYENAPADSPPPPADLKAEAVAWRAKYGRFASWVCSDGAEGPSAEDRAACLKMWPDFIAEPLYPPSALTAAHAAGKAEGRAEESAEINRHIDKVKAATDDVSDEAIIARARAEALGEARQKIAAVSDDWRDAGDMSKVHACDYLLGVLGRAEK